MRILGKLKYYIDQLERERVIKFHQYHHLCTFTYATPSMYVSLPLSFLIRLTRPNYMLVYLPSFI